MQARSLVEIYYFYDEEIILLKYSLLIPRGTMSSLYALRPILDRTGES